MQAKDACAAKFMNMQVARLEAKLMSGTLNQNLTGVWTTQILRYWFALCNCSSHCCVLSLHEQDQSSTMVRIIHGK